MEPNFRMDPDSTTRLAPLVGAIIDDAQKLVRQEMALLRREVEGQWTKAKLAVTAFTLAVVALAVSGILLAFFLVHGLVRLSGLPQWACFGIFTVVFGIAGYLLFKKGRLALDQIKFVALDPANIDKNKENVKWIKNRT